MPLLKSIFEAMIRFLKQVWALPLAIAGAVRQRQQRLARSVLEAERLDRIRHPSKYLGKS